MQHSGAQTWIWILDPRKQRLWCDFCSCFILALFRWSQPKTLGHMEPSSKMATTPSGGKNISKTGEVKNLYHSHPWPRTETLLEETKTSASSKTYEKPRLETEEKKKTILKADWFSENDLQTWICILTLKISDWTFSLNYFQFWTPRCSQRRNCNSRPCGRAKKRWIAFTQRCLGWNSLELQTTWKKTCVWPTGFRWRDNTIGVGNGIKLGNGVKKFF